MTRPARAALLVLGVGNPSRGDDALGSLFLDRLEQALHREIAEGRIELLTDFQLQIEHALDLIGRERVVFVDASVHREPLAFRYDRVSARRDASFSTHALSPAAVLDAFRAVGGEPPAAWALAIHGERFELGEGLSSTAAANLEAALSFFLAEVRALLAPSSRRIELEGAVQGVGLRPWVQRTAETLGIGGRVFNTPRGVTIEAHGAPEALEALLERLRAQPPPAARITRSTVTDMPKGEPTRFTIDASEEGEGLLSIPPDLGTCAACLREVDEPTDRHHGYAFTSCTECGPRYSVVTALPYDRARTSMAPFPPCADCAAEYRDPSDRRFHAQTIACPACGPRLWLASADGAPIAGSDPLGAAAERLLRGEILGVQGLGGFHLACDATRAEVVAELRRRKRRDLKPFAVMVKDLEAAEALVLLDEPTRRALTSPARPIVLVPARPTSSVAEGARGPSSRLGLFLAPTPLHHRLLALVNRPLVMTSGNLSGEPVAVTHDEARRTLGPIVDAFLLHDRPIVRRVEDSVIAPSAGSLRVLRRARGHAPDAIRLPASAPEPILAVGGHLKSTACLVIGDRAYLTPHLGDLESWEAEEAFVADVEGLERLLGVRAEVVAHDLHPDYASTQYAMKRSARRRIGVQHHLAHVLAALAEHRLEEPVLGVVFDGSGWGLDGTAWGAELVSVHGAAWSRASSFRALPLAGGERAIREVWRTGYGALVEAFGDEAIEIAARLPVFRELPEAALPTLARMIEGSVQTVRARGMGRFFDAIGALVLGIPRASFEGHVAMAWEEVGAGLEAPAYPVVLPSAIDGGDVLSAAQEIDLRPTFRAAVEDHLAGLAAHVISARFHQTIIEATAAVAERILASAEPRRVVLSGGSFQNRILLEGVRDALGAERVIVAREVPVNDGGLALGQAWAGVLALRGDPR